MNNKLKLNNISIKKGWEVEEYKDFIVLKSNKIGKEIGIKIDSGWSDKEGKVVDDLVMFCCSEEDLLWFGNLSGIDFVNDELDEEFIYRGWENVNDMIDDIEEFMLKYN